MNIDEELLLKARGESKSCLRPLNSLFSAPQFVMSPRDAAATN